MQYRKLGKTALVPSVIGLGTWQYCGDWGLEFSAGDVADILAAAKEDGINLIDTAECYGNHLSEELLGQALAGGGREGWLISSKFGHHQPTPGAPKQNDFSVAGVQKQLEDSLRALCTDYLDLYLFHSGSNEELANDDLWTMLKRQQQAGKVRYLGLSLAPDIRDNIRQARFAVECGLDAMEVLYNRLERVAEDGVLPLCQKHGLGVIGRVPLCSGYLSGKYDETSVFAASDIRTIYHLADEREEKLMRAALIREFEVPPNEDMAVWAMAWCLRHPAVSTIVAGFKNPQQLRAGVQAAQLADPAHPLAARQSIA